MPLSDETVCRGYQCGKYIYITVMKYEVPTVTWDIFISSQADKNEVYKILLNQKDFQLLKTTEKIALYGI